MSNDVKGLKNNTAAVLVNWFVNYVMHSNSYMLMSKITRQLLAFVANLIM